MSGPSNRSAPAKVFGIGIDFGTSNSVAAIFDGETVRIVEFGQGKNSLPSACYLNSSLLAITGQEALDAYIEDNTGRRVELAAIALGEANTSTGSYDSETGLPQTAQPNLIFSQAMFDVNLPGRLFYGIKQMLSASDDTVLPVFDKQYRLEAIITPILLRIREGVEATLAQLGAAQVPDHAVIGRPVRFERSADGGNARAERRLSTAFHHAGFRNQQPCFEPVGAAINYLHSQRERPSGTLLTVDFGGGTLDLCLFREGEEGFTVLGTYGVALGGNHIDQMLYAKLLFPLLGEGTTGKFFTPEGWVESRFVFSEYAERLLNWPVSYLLNQNRYLTPLREMVQHGGEHAAKFQRLLDLIQFNYSYLVLQKIKAFKESFATQETSTLDLPELDLALTLDRRQFEAAIAPATAQFQQALDEAISSMGADADKIDRVICVGGSTQLAPIRNTLEQRFPGRVVTHDIFTSVAAGLAIRDYQRQCAGSP
jgi:hypothetical chaperone protein